MAVRQQDDRVAFGWSSRAPCASGTRPLRCPPSRLRCLSSRARCRQQHAELVLPCIVVLLRGDCFIGATPRTSSSRVMPWIKLSRYTIALSIAKPRTGRVRVRLPGRSASRLLPDFSAARPPIGTRVSYSAGGHACGSAARAKPSTSSLRLSMSRKRIALVGIRERVAAISIPVPVRRRSPIRSRAIRPTRPIDLRPRVASAPVARVLVLVVFRSHRPPPAASLSDADVRRYTGPRGEVRGGRALSDRSRE